MLWMKTRPLYFSYAHLDAGEGELLFQYGSYFLAGFRARGQQKLETERNAVFVPYSITIAVAPPRFIKKRPCLLRVIGIGLYVLWIFRAIYVKSRSYYLPETQENFSQE